MDNLGDWIYIVLLVVVAISGIFSSGKKKKLAEDTARRQRRAAPSQDSPRDRGFWEVLEEMQDEMQEVKKPVAEKRPSAKAVARKQAAPSPFLTVESTIPGMQVDRTTPILFEDVHNDPHRITGDDFHLQDVDEVRKAILYSEILNRKYS